MRTKHFGRLAVALAIALTAVLLSPGTANAWTVTVQISGAGTIDETTPANLMNCTAPYSDSTHNCVAGSQDGPYSSGWGVTYVATARPGYTFSHWASPTGGDVICDEVNGPTWGGSECSFTTWQNLSVRAVFVDNNAPSTPTFSSVPSSPTKQTSATFQLASSTDPTLKAHEWRLDGGSWVESSGLSRSVTVTTNGSHTMDVRALDHAGNRSSIRSFTWTLDTVAPTATILAPAHGTVTNAQNVTLSGSTSEGNTEVSVYVNGALQGIVPSNGAWSYTRIAPAEGTYSYWVTARDAAGNTSTATPTRTFTVDRTAPALDVQAPTSGSYDRDGDIALSGTAEPGATVVVREGDAEVATLVVGDDGVWSATATDRVDGAHTFTVRATDAAGNLTALERTVTVDTTAPLAAVVSPPNGATKVKRGVSLKAVFSEAVRAGTVSGSTVYVVRKGTTKKVPAAVTYDAATRQVVLDPRDRLRPGTVYVATVTRGVKDLAGNRLLSGLRWSFKTG